MNLLDDIQNSFYNLMQSFIMYIPSLINALLILLVGWVIAKIIQWVILRLSHAMGIDNLAKKSGVHRFLEKRGVKNGFSGILSRICFWAIMLIVLVNFFNHLGLELVSDLLNQLLLFIPNVLISCVLIIIGFYLAEFVSSLVFSSLEESNFENPDLIGKLVFYSIAFFTVAIALTQMGIGETIITNIVSIFFGTIGLALAISFGIGGKSWAEEIIKRYFYSDPKDPDQKS
ncbi:MAG: hypothetical protein IPP06_11380 [Saprospiraceae bacterium]|nr:hypothetical protein [Candidatus Vicinibacter affinis]MBP6172809.1 hypothetical protein [Saprospiraceae bacterium]MBK6572688.1 hypothetical protein [Candidatus Vicinibacter affinis]MBK7303457.1 hypothetical protein [Candidatus Vicinibacter affinis]MBK7696126.1 hypothetical protein [Candidatus Vicinibacter affinis]